MAQAPCESSLRPDWLGVTFRSTTARHQQQVWEMVQHHISRVTDDSEWDVSSASRHFENCLRHEIGARFEASGMQAKINAGVSVLNLSGMYWALSSVYEQMRFITHLNEFKGRYHWTRLDAQVTSLEPDQTAEQICEDVQERRLWIKGYQGWEQKGVKDLDGKVLHGASACFGAASSNRRATSYNKSAEQGWKIPARRDEVRLRGEWAEQHTNAMATAIAGAASEDAAISAYQETTSAAIAQHMQYLDITGTPIPKPKNWARGKKAPQWWSETLEQEFTPVKLNRKAEDDIETRFAYMKSQWARTFAEYLGYRVRSGKSDSFLQSSIDTSLQLLQHAKADDVLRVAEGLPEEHRAAFIAAYEGSIDLAASHSEMVL